MSQQDAVYVKHTSHRKTYKMKVKDGKNIPCKRKTKLGEVAILRKKSLRQEV